MARYNRLAHISVKGSLLYSVNKSFLASDVIMSIIRVNFTVDYAYTVDSA